MYFMDSSAIRAFNGYLKSLGESETAYEQFKQEFQKTWWKDYEFPSREEVQSLHQNRETSPFFSDITWFLLEKFSTQNYSLDYHLYLILLDLTYLGETNDEIQRLQLLTKSPLKRIRRRAKRKLLLSRKNFIPSGDSKDRQYYQDALQKLNDELNALSQLNEGSYLIYMFND